MSAAPALRCLLAGAALAGLFLSLGAGARPPLSGGDTTTHLINEDAFSLPAANLSLVRRDGFFVGNSFFTNAWVSAPASTTARDGLGPLFNTNTCQGCHLKDGRGRLPDADEPLTSALVRISLPNEHRESEAALRRDGVVPEPSYGGQIQNRALPGMRPEARVRLRWEDIEGEFADGTPYTLRRPVVTLTDLAYGPLHPDTRMSLRVAPPLIGMGLLEAIPEWRLEELADPHDDDGDLISGRINRVWDRSAGSMTSGRFGWKAGQPTVRQQVAAAFAGDMGLTTGLYPEPPCSPAQRECLEAPHGGDPEVEDPVLEVVAFYARHLGVPPRRDHDGAAVRRGEELFQSAGCSACHVETHRTGEVAGAPELSNQEIHPYTDLLLHEMGEGLADGRTEFRANRREWRTPPLWGIGLTEVVSRHTRFLHDGRARNLQEAILWHGGEARRSRQHFLQMDRRERDHLLQFLQSL